MKQMMLFFSLLIVGKCHSQPASTFSSGNVGAVKGNVLILPIQSLRVELNNSNPILFSGASDYNITSGKDYLNHFKLYVVSTVPWVIEVKAVAENFTGLTDGASLMPVSLLKLKAHNTNTAFPSVNLSAGVQTLLYATTNNIQTVHDVDLNFTPGWNYSGGNYSTTLVFTLSSQ